MIHMLKFYSHSDVVVRRNVPFERHNMIYTFAEEPSCGFSSAAGKPIWSVYHTFIPG